MAEKPELMPILQMWDEARRIASNIVKLPNFLAANPHSTDN
jgi:hypothetical protein